MDGLVVYAAACFFIGVSALAQVRLALEPAFLALAMAYGVGCLGQGGRTLGKVLMGIAVAPTAGGSLGWAGACKREVGKWLLLGAAPGIAGRLVFGRAWVPTAYDLVAVLFLLLAALVYYACCRRTWYDQLAGTGVIRRPVASGTTRSAFAILAGVTALGCAVKVAEQVSIGRLPSRTLLYYGMGSTKPYVDFLRRAAVSPNDYIFSLFDRYDVVVLSERDHSEATQWDFIFNLVSDPRFVQRVGHVFTELGQVGMQSYLDDFMATDGLSGGQVEERVLHIMRNWAVWPTWNRVNFPTYLKRLYALNQTLPAARRIQHHFTDGAVDWANLTLEKMGDHWRALGNRDEKMARQVIAGMERLDRAGGKPAKSLVIMNFRHAFDLRGASTAAAPYNTFEFIREALGGRAANVRLNEGLYWPVAGGLWDEAFERNGNRPAGFDLAGSLFGQEPFDLFPWTPSVRARLRYQDVFTGFVFLNAPRAQYRCEGIPGYYRGWEEEARRRAALIGPDFVKAVEQEIAREKQGRVPVKEAPIAFTIEAWVGTIVAALFGVGFVIGLTAFIFRSRLYTPVLASTLGRACAGASELASSAPSRLSPRLWFCFVGAIVASVFVHETGHCLVAWLHGCPAIPTPAKEYILKPLTASVQNQVALGGILGSAAALAGALYWLFRTPGPTRSALVAGAMVMPGFYVLRFILAGRGHDGAEFQEAQTALGFSYSGHAVDWMFVGLFVAAATAWFWHTRPRASFRLAGRLSLGVLVGVLVVVFLQSANNAIFDSLFRP